MVMWNNNEEELTCTPHVSAVYKSFRMNFINYFSITLRLKGKKYSGSCFLGYILIVETNTLFYNTGEGYG